MREQHAGGASQAGANRAWTRTGMSPALAALAGFWAFGFIAFFGTQVTTFDPALRLVTAVAYGLPVVIGAAGAVAIRSHPLDVPVLALLGIYAVVSLMSVDQTASLETVALATAYGSLFLLLLRVGPGPVQQGLVVGCAVAGTAWLGIMAARWIGEAVTWVALDGGMPPLQARSGNPWLSTDAVAALAILVAPYYLRIDRSSLRRVLLVAGLASAAVVIPLSGARAAWAAILLAAVVWFLASPRRPLGEPRRAIAATLGIAAVAGVALFALGRLGTLSGRTFIWQTALPVIGGHPLDGAGPGTFSWVRLDEAPELLQRYPVYHAHNVVLQTLADGGVLLFAALAAVCFLFVRHVMRGRASFTPAQIASIGSLLAFALILMLDELTQLPALTTLALGTAAFLARDVGSWPAHGATRAPMLRAIPTIACLLLVALALPASLSAQSARAAAVTGGERAIAGDWEGARQAYGAAAEAWPQHASYELALGLAAAHLGDEEDALTHYERARALSPGDPRALGALGVIGDSAAGRVDALGRASRLGAMDSQYGYRLVLELLARGDREAATTELGRAALLDPQLLVALDVVGLGLSVDEVVEALRVALEREGPLAGIDPVGVEAAIAIALGRTPQQDPIWAALALARSGDVAGARAQMDEVLHATPHDHAARLAARELSRVACDDAEEARHNRLLGLLPGGHASLYLAAPTARESRDHIYREMGLGDYQPPGATPLPVYVYEWPAAYLAATGCSRP
jgi:tetratricopeptide (TPR) repeat protein